MKALSVALFTREDENGNRCKQYRHLFDGGMCDIDDDFNSDIRAVRRRGIAELSTRRQVLPERQL